MNRSASARFVRIPFIMMIVVMLMVTLITANVAESEEETEDKDENFVYLEDCTSKVKIDLHKDHPNNIFKINLFKKFPENPGLSCRTNIYASVVEFYNAWKTRSLTPRLSNYKVMVTLEDINMPQDCKKIYSLVEDAQRNRTLLCHSLSEQIYHYQFNLFYIRNNELLLKDYFIDLTVSVAYLPPPEEDDSDESESFRGCPSNEFFQCLTDGLCIPSRFWCDTFAHCTDSSDERDCHKQRETIVDASTEEKTISPDEQLISRITTTTPVGVSDESKEYTDESDAEDDEDDGNTDSDEVTESLGEIADKMEAISTSQEATDPRTPVLTITKPAGLSKRPQQTHPTIVAPTPVTSTSMSSEGPFTTLSTDDTTLISESNSETSSVAATATSTASDTATAVISTTWPKAQSHPLENGNIDLEVTAPFELSTPFSLKESPASTKATALGPSATALFSGATQTELPKTVTSVESHITDSYEDYDNDPNAATSPKASASFSTLRPASGVDRSHTTTLTTTSTDSIAWNGGSQHANVNKHDDGIRTRPKNRERHETEAPMHFDRDNDVSTTVKISKGTKERKSTTVKPHFPFYSSGPRSDRLDSPNSSSRSSVNSVSLLEIGLALTGCAAMLWQQVLL